MSIALSSGQSAMASEPSFIPSVSRLGEATDPVSRWSRPITIGAATLPFRTSQLNRRPISARSPYSSQQIRAGSPWKWTFSGPAGSSGPATPSPGKVSSTAAIGHGDVGGIARRGPPSETGRRPGRRAAG